MPSAFGVTRRFLEHHIPETCYFLQNLAAFALGMPTIGGSWTDAAGDLNIGLRYDRNYQKGILPTIGFWQYVWGGVGVSFLDRIRDAFAGGNVSPEHLAGYRRIGEQVYEVEVELAACEHTKARAFLQAAKNFQVMADALLRDAFQSDGHASTSVPEVTHRQAEAWYGRIPELLIAARQEAAIDGSAKIALPIQLGDGIDFDGPCPVPHLASLRRAVDDLETLFNHRMERIRLHADKYKEVILKYEEARTRRQAGDAIVGSIMNGGHVTEDNRDEAGEQYFDALSSYLLIAQGLEDPSVAEYVFFKMPGGNGGYDATASTGSWQQNNVHLGGANTGMNFGQMEQQANMIQQHNGNIIQQLQQVVGNIQALNVDDSQKQAITYALRELALSVKGLNQETMGLVQNMAMYIQNLENTHPQSQQYQQNYPPQYQQRGGGLFGGGGGFWNTIVQSAEMGAGFAIGEDIVGDIFGGW